MLQVNAKDRHQYCDGLTRRSFVKAGALSVAGLTMADWLRVKAQAAQPNGQATRDTAVILIWLDGGPTHMDTYDIKTEAPAEYRGPMQTCNTNVSGVQICSLMPQQARQMDKLAIVRSLTHATGDHFAGAHWMTTGYHGSTAARQAPMYPSIGSYAAKLRGPNRPGLPAYVSVPYASTVGIRPGYLSGAYLGRAYDPFQVNSDPNRRNFSVQNLVLPGGVTLAQLENRRNLLRTFDTMNRGIDQSGVAETMDHFQREAFEMITGPRARQAFNIGQEDPRLRDRYGRHSWGQSCLLARRLVEAGVTFVSVHLGGWDNHSQIENAMKRQLPIYDRAVGTLVEDLNERNLYNKVAICVMGEFGRTPRVNGSAGRDHWGRAGFSLLGGGGIRGGQVVGSTNVRGERPANDPQRPGDILATLYKVLGIDTSRTFNDPSGRPHQIVRDGRAIRQLI